MSMKLKEQKQAFPVGAAVIATVGYPPYFTEGARGIVKKHYSKGSVYVRFARSSGALVSASGDRDWFADPEELCLLHPTPALHPYQEGRES